MTPEQKKRIIKRFIEESSSPQPYVINSRLVEQLPKFRELADALDTLEASHNGLLDFPNVEHNPGKWNVLTGVLKSGLTLNVGTPAVVTAVNPVLMQQKAQSIIDDGVVLDRLPQPDYYNRTTQTDADTQRDTIDPLITAARDKLAGFLGSFVEGTDFDKTSNEDIESLITQLKAEIKRAETANQAPQLELAKKRLTVAEDLLKVNKLTAMTIPSEHGAPNQTFCTLAESAGGVTEKVSLVSLGKVTTQLGRLRDTAVGSIDDYVNHRGDYKLSTEAILKLPKHGKIEEVQRESMALNISRILGLNTTRSTMLTHEGKPALFVPFDNIKLMKEFAKGKEFNAFNPNPFATASTYEHYSTINPVGQGLQGDQFIDDFGSAFSLFYVCSDTDSVGGYNQNKALRDSRSLFIFDQVVMPSDKMKLDSRLSLQPDEFIMKHTRHGQGRNRTLIEDSSFTRKFDSIVNLLDKQEQIYRYARRTANYHNAEIAKIEADLRRPHTDKEKKELKAQKEQLTTLRDDALKLKDVIRSRIDQISDILPKRSRDLNKVDVRQALVLEKLIHNPVLFTEGGRPYKYPWTNRQNNPVKTLATNSSGNIVITFDSKVSKDMVSFLQRAGINSLRPISGNQLEISRHDLDRLSEDMLHPETQVALQDKSYLNRQDLVQISKAYGKGNRTQILDLTQLSQRMLQAPKYTAEQKLNIMDDTRIRLQDFINNAKDKGFGMHVMKKFNFDMQQRLQTMLAPELKASVNEGFSAAIKYDQMELFNKVVSSAIRNNKLESPEFRQFIQACRTQGALPVTPNHDDAVRASTMIKELGEEALKVFRLPPILPLSDLINVDDIDPVAEREEQIAVERPTLGGLGPTISAPLDEVNAPPVTNTEGSDHRIELS